MTTRLVGAAGLILLIGVGFLPVSDTGSQPPGQAAGDAAKDTKPGPQAWTLDEAVRQLQQHPRDPFLVYVALQLARREGRVDEVTTKLKLRSLWDINEIRSARARQVNLFNIFSGAVAVQESLQLDAMRGELIDLDAPLDEKKLETIKAILFPTVPEEVEDKATEFREQAREFEGFGLLATLPTTYFPAAIPWLAVVNEDNPHHFAEEYIKEWEQQLFVELQRKRVEQIPLDKLSGPTLKSHPWQKMLDGRKPKVSPLSQCVPHDFYFVEFRSVGKLLETLQTQDLWSRYLFNQAFHNATDPQLVQRYATQIALPLGPTLHGFYSQSVQELAVCGSDLFFEEGTDVTVLFRYQGDKFRDTMDAFLDGANKQGNGATRADGKLLGVEYKHVTTPDRSLCVFSAYPQPGLHVRSNSKVALRRVLEAIQGKDAAGFKVQRLGDTHEFKYIRTLMKTGAKEEDGLIYLSDPFIRHMVGPALKLVERRRLLAFNHLKMIGHAAHLFLTERGKTADTLEALTRADCTPGPFNDTPLACPFGSKYLLAADGLTGISEVCGRAAFMTPCCEIELHSVNGLEAEFYKQFLDDYNKYWSNVFDPIALRVQVTPKKYRLETIILPLIENSIYSQMAKTFDGPPEPLDALPVPKRNLFSMSFMVNEDLLLNQLAEQKKIKEALTPITKINQRFANAPLAGFPAGVPWGYLVEQVDAAQDRSGTQNAYLYAPLKGVISYEVDLPNREKAVALAVKVQEETKLIRTFVTEGIGRQIGIHIYDAELNFAHDLPGYFGQGLGSSGNISEYTMNSRAFMVMSLFAPGYISVPVKDAQIVDKFLEHVDKELSQQARLPLGDGGGLFSKQDFYKLTTKGGLNIRCYSMSIGPAKVRMFWGRVGDGLYVANQPYIFDDLHTAAVAQKKAGKPADPGPVAHALFKLRPLHWKQALAGYQLGWAESDRISCLHNQGPLASAARAVAAKTKANASWDKRNVLPQAHKLYGLHFFCPGGGDYEFSPDGKKCHCSIHGSAANPKQELTPAADSPLATLMDQFADLTAALTFEEDGLRAVVVIEKK